MKFRMYIAAGAILAALAIPATAQGRQGPVSNTVRLLGFPEVRKELKLTPSQTESIVKLQTGLKTRLLDTLRSLKGVPPADRTKKFAAFRDGIDRQVVEILDAPQRKRLRELELQKDGVRALTQPAFAAELRLTPEQVSKIHASTQAENSALRQLFTAASKKDPMTTADRKKLQDQVEARRKETDEELTKVLTPDQRSKLRVLQGAPFTFPERKLTVAPPAGSSAKPTVKPALPAKK